MKPVVRPEVASTAQKFGLDLNKLSEDQLSALDGNRDGDIGETEVKAAVDLFDTNRSGKLDAAEHRRLALVLDAPSHPYTFTRADAEYLNARVADGFELVERRATQAFSQDDDRLSDARRNLGNAPVPSAPSQQLQASLDRIRPANEANQKMADALTQQLAASQQRLGQVRTELQELRRGAAAGLKPNTTDPRIAAADQLTEQRRALLNKLKDAHALVGDDPNATPRKAEKRDAAVAKLQGEINALKREILPDEAAIARKQEMIKYLKESYPTNTTARSIRDIEENLESTQRLSTTLSGAQQRLDALTAEEASLQRQVVEQSWQLRGVTAALQSPYSGKPAQERLEKQVPFQQAREAASLTNAQLHAVHGLATLARSYEQVSVNETLSTGYQELRKAEVQVKDLERRNANYMKLAAGPAALKALASGPKPQLDPGDIQMRYLDRHLNGIESKIQQNNDQIDAFASSMIRQLEDPTFQQSLDRLSPDDKAAVINRHLAILSKSQRGKEYFEKQIRPALEGKPDANAFWKGVLQPPVVPEKGTVEELQAWTKKADIGTKVSVKVLGGLGGLIASQPDASKLLDNSVKTALRLSSTEGVKELQASLLKWKEIKDKLGPKPSSAALRDAQLEFRKVMKDSSLVRLADKIDLVADTVSAVSGAVAIAEAFKRPSIRTALEGVKGASDVAKGGANLAARIAEEGGHWATFAKAAGSLGNIATAVLADMDRRDAAEHGDVGGTVGSSLTEMGASMAATGLALDATGVGAALGVPLNIAGSVIAVIGAVVRWFCKDSDTDKWLKANGLVQFSKHKSYAIQQDY